MFGGQVQTCFDLSLLVQTCQKGKKYDFFLKMYPQLLTITTLPAEDCDHQSKF